MATSMVSHPCLCPAERGGSLKKVLSSKLTEQGLDKAIKAIAAKNPAFGAYAPLVHSLKPMVTDAVGDLVENLGKKKKPEAQPEGPKKESRAKSESQPKKVDDEHDSTKRKDEENHDDDGGAWDKLKDKIGAGGDDANDEDERDDATRGQKKARKEEEGAKEQHH